MLSKLPCCLSSKQRRTWRCLDSCERKGSWVEEASQGDNGGHCGNSCREQGGGNRCAVSRPVQFSRSVMSDSLQPMDCSMPSFPVLHQLPELAQTHVHQVGDAIQPLILCRPLLFLPPISFPALRSFPTSPFFHQVAKVLEFQLQHQSFQ